MLKSLFQSTADPSSGNFSRVELEAIADTLPTKLREPIATYLRSAPMFFAWMELTEDLLGGKFRVPGGSAINSDGAYYWRLDTADYVEHYGIGIPQEFVDHVCRVRWVTPTFDELAFLEIYAQLEQISRSHEDGSTQDRLQTYYPKK